jgi:ABC-type multidrug transport system ATPase subunit
MQIELEDIGRRFNREWIFRKVNYNFEEGNSYAVLGPNGSGKSTLLQIIAGNLSSSEGTISYFSNNRKIEIEDVFKKLSWAAPYIELIEEFTLTELINFHFRFKPLLPSYSTRSVIELAGLETSKNKAVKFFSSGMKQRTKLALAFCADTPVLLLDEPTSNLDSAGIDWYLRLVENFAENRLLIVCSNQEHEYRFCRSRLHLLDYK